jgi:hypothetical protein
MKIMTLKLKKHLVIFFIALGLSLSLVICIEYDCTGTEMFPTYYGSPFVFKKTSLGSSMQFFYSIFGIILNLIIWYILVYCLNMIINKLIEATHFSKLSIIIYKISIVFFLLFSFLIILMTWLEIGSGFGKNFNYWIWNLNKDANDWGMICDGKWRFFIF